MRARGFERYVAGWLAWVRWSMCWDMPVAHRTLERLDVDARHRPWRLS